MPAPPPTMNVAGRGGGGGVGARAGAAGGDAVGASERTGAAGTDVVVGGAPGVAPSLVEGAAAGADGSVGKLADGVTASEVGGGALDCARSASGEDRTIERAVKRRFTPSATMTPGYQGAGADGNLTGPLERCCQTSVDGRRSPELGAASKRGVPPANAGEDPALVLAVGAPRRHARRGCRHAGPGARPARGSERSGAPPSLRETWVSPTEWRIRHHR
jgi:hypothetical protein